MTQDMREPTVAIVMRTKNRPLLLQRAIQSAAAQYYKDFLIVIVNDGGDPEPIQKLISKSQKTLRNKITLVNNKTSLGHGAACNVGIKNSDSKYIVMLDDDDTWHRDFLKETVDYLEASADYGVVTASEIIYETLVGGKINPVSKKPFLPGIKQISLFSMLGGNQFPNMAFVYRREAIKKVGLYNNESSPLEDWDFNVRFLKNYDVHFIDKVLVSYHQRETQAGDLGNSIFVSSNLHNQQYTRLLNKFLREDLANGSLGAGFIANLSQQSMWARSEDLTFLNNLIRQSAAETHNGINTLHERIDAIARALIGVRFQSYLRRRMNESKKRNKKGLII